jgi:gamma-glutamylputrescine oxidase
MFSSHFTGKAGPGGEHFYRHAPSFYAATAPSGPAAPTLAGSYSADVCIVGGGFAGLGAALALARAGKRAVLVEAGPLGWGASGRNGGQVHMGWNQDQPWLERKLGAGPARALWDVALAARDHLDGLIALDPERCDFRPGHVHADHRARLVAGSHAHVAHMRETYGYRDLRAVGCEEMRVLVDSPCYFGGTVDARGGHLHPLKLAHGIARAAVAAGAVVHGGSPCTAIRRRGAGWQVETPGGTVEAAAVLVATGGYGTGLLPLVDAHVLPINNFIVVTAPLGAEASERLIAGGRSVSDSRFVVRYFRMTQDHRLLFGGGESYGWRFPADIGSFVRPHLERTYPQLAGTAIDYAWGGTLSITPDRLPHVQQVQPGLWSLNGFSGVGVVLGPYLGAAVGEMLAGQPGMAFAALSSLPGPRFPGGPALRWPTMVAALGFLGLRDRF